MKKLLLGLGLVGLAWGGLPLPDYLSARFEQSVQNRDANRTLRYEGQLKFVLPDKAKWRYTKPVPKTICLDGNRAWIIEPDLEQATLIRLEETIPLLAILKKAKKTAPQRYEAEYGGVIYTLTVTREKLPQTVAYTDELGNRVTIRFSDLQISTIPTKALTCKIPDGFDIVDGRY